MLLDWKVTHVFTHFTHTQSELEGFSQFVTCQWAYMGTVQLCAVHLTTSHSIEHIGGTFFEKREKMFRIKGKKKRVHMSTALAHENTIFKKGQVC